MQMDTALILGRAAIRDTFGHWTFSHWADGMVKLMRAPATLDDTPASR